MKIKISNSITQSEFEEIDLSLTTRRGAEYIVGRSPDSDLVLDSEDVSRRHGKFFSQSGNYYFSDLGSRNGTILNGKSAEKNHSYILKNGDILRIGDFALIMEEDMSPYEQSETVVRIINPSMFSNRQVSRNISVPDVATPSSELVNQSQEVAEPVISESIAFDTPIAKEIDNAEKVVNTFEESTLVQSFDEELAVNSADIITLDNAVEPQEDADLDIPVEEEITANISGVESEYTIVQARDVFQNDEDNLDLDTEEIAAQSQEAISQEDNLELDVEEISEPLQENDIEITEGLLSEAVSISTSDLISEDSNVIISQEIQEESAEDISEEASTIKLAKILEDKQIVLISHETKKSELLELITEHEEFLSYCLTRTWQSFSDYLYRESGLSVTQEIPPATSGGYQAINSLINSREIIAVIFLRDFIVPQPGQASEEALLRTCNINEILLATNLPTAQAVIHYLKNMKD